jgi:protein-L-isoaspartate(D-aspartate) O-methyltransferase
VTTEDPFRSARLVLELRQSGITDLRLLNAIETLPRSVFLAEHMVEAAFDDVALPIECGQTISRPMAVAGMVYALRPGPELSCLEIGTGSGYQTAILGRLFRRVFSVERYRTLVDLARARLAGLGFTNVEVLHSDGLNGWPGPAPYDRILMGGAVSERPERLLAQLKPDGVLVGAIGEGDGQHVVAFTGDGAGGFTETVVAPSRFLMLQSGLAREL